MNIAIIDMGWIALSNKTLQEKAVGGSESWFLQTAQAFANQGHSVDLYCKTEDWFVDASKMEMYVDGNIRYIPLRQIVNVFSQGVYYDFVVLNRIIYNYDTKFIALIKRHHVTDCVLYQLHDLSMCIQGEGESEVASQTVIVNDSMIHDLLLDDDVVKGFVTLNEWHANNFHLQYPSIPVEKIFVSPNGVDQDFINVAIKKKDHRVLWSSCAERGLSILINDIYPRVRQVIPDFGIDVAGYNSDYENLKAQAATMGLDINFLGRLGKPELYANMRQHCCWFYPGTFAETFCITMIENILSENVIVSPLTYGMRPVLGEWADIVAMQNTFDDYRHDYSINRDTERYKKACDEAADKIIDAILNYDKYAESLKELKLFATQYTWENTANHYIGIYNKIYENQLEGVFLAQSCNHPFFTQGEEIVRETWAKDIIDGKYPGYKYFAYTAATAEHPEGIEGNMIYVNASDERLMTFSKMKRAYQVLRQHYTFKNMFRTNTSTYVNVPEAIKMMEANDMMDITSDICGYYLSYPDKEEPQFQFNTFTGNGYIMSQRLADILFYSDFDESMTYVADGDDILTARLIRMMNLNVNYKGLNTNKTLNNSSYRYKAFNPADMERFKEDQGLMDRYTTDANKIKDQATMSIRTMYLDLDERVSRGNELEHMREIHKSFKKLYK